MALLDTAMAVGHLLFAGLWTGSVAFFPYAVLPPALDGDARVGALRSQVSRLTTLTRLSALVLFVTGGHMAGTRYTVETLTGSTRGYLVLAMVALWFVLATLVEVGAARMRRGLDEEKVRTPAREGRPLFLAASAVAVLLLVDAGLLLGGV